MMRKAAYSILILILALAALGCERENLSYNRQKEEKPADTTAVSLPDTLPSPNDNPDDPANPDQPEQPDADSILLSQFAKRLSGQWTGTLATEYFDYRGIKVELSGTADLTFQLSEEGAHGGNGLELNYQDGKQVYRMSFTWQLGGDHRLHLTYTDKRTMTSDECRFTGDSLLLVVTDARDGLETSVYHLQRGK